MIYKLPGWHWQRWRHVKWIFGPLLGILIIIQIWYLETLPNYADDIKNKGWNKIKDIKLDLPPVRVDDYQEKIKNIR